MNEFYRVLKPRGHLLLTVPSGPEFCENYTEYYGYEKRYCLNAINERLINKNKFDTKKIRFIKNKSEKGNVFAEFWYHHELYALLGKFSPFLSFGLYEISEKFDDKVIGSVICLTKKDTK
jgi:predicted SAM-dependent methyltransferase